MEDNTIVSLKLRQANADDLKLNHNQLKEGQPFWYRSIKTGHFSNKPYLLSYDLDLNELLCHLDLGMIWIPKSDLEINYVEDEPILKETA